MQEMKYLKGYSEDLKNQVQQLVVLLRKYAGAHDIRTGQALYRYVLDLKNNCMCNAEPINIATRNFNRARGSVVPKCNETLAVFSIWP